VTEKEEDYILVKNVDGKKVKGVKKHRAGMSKEGVA